MNLKRSNLWKIGAGVGGVLLFLLSLYGWRGFSKRLERRKAKVSTPFSDFLRESKQKKEIEEKAKEQISISEKKEIDSIEEIKRKLEKRNPFLAPRKEKKVKKIVSQKEEDLDLSPFFLSAIFYSPYKRRVVINGRILKEQDEILGAKILHIEEQKVILGFKGKEYILRLKDVNR